MKITCQSCGKRYDTDIDELCPKCGSYNPINKETADPNGSYAEEKSYQDHGKYRWEPQQQEQEEPEDQKKQISWKPKSRPVQQNAPSLEKNKGKGGCLGFIFSRLAIFCVVLMLVQQGCELLREPIRRQVMEQIGSITIREYEMQESFELDNGIVASVEDSQSLELTEEWIAELSQNQTFWDDMRLTAVFLNLETDGEFLTNDSGQTVYLKAGGHVYRPTYSWIVEEEVCEQYGASPVVGYDEEEAGLKGIIFLLPEEIQKEEQTFCIQQNSTIPFVGVEKADSRIQVKLQKEA